ncbi:MAG TPA: hypothetical protein VIQ30_02640 [Pseudonocardia sp.]
MADKPQRTCNRCGQTDDAPRDVIYGGANFHMDCHALMGCPTCIKQLADADGAQGDDLRAHLISLTPTTPNMED